MTKLDDEREFVCEVWAAILAEGADHTQRLHAAAHLHAEGVLTPGQAGCLHALFEADAGVLTGPDGPPWTSARMRAALARRDLQQVFTILRGCGWSQRRIGAAIGTGQSEVSEIVTGSRHARQYDLFAKVALAFGLPRGWLGLAYDPQTAVILRAELAGEVTR